MRRLLLGLLGAVEFLFPKRVIAFSTRLASRSPGDVEVEPWVVTAVRIEGLALLYLALRGLGGRDGDGGIDVERSDGPPGSRPDRRVDAGPS